MKILISILSILLSFTVLSQRYIYKAKKFSTILMEDENSKWSKYHRTDIFMVFNTDTLNINDSLVVNRTVIIYSGLYQEYNLLKINLINSDSDGNYSFDFKAKDILGDDCDFSFTYYKKKVYVIIHYQGFAIKYVLRKKRSVSFDLETRKLSISSITKDSNNISG